MAKSDHYIPVSMALHCISTVFPLSLTFFDFPPLLEPLWSQQWSEDWEMLFPQDWLAAPTVPGSGDFLGLGEGAAMVRPMLSMARLRRESFIVKEGRLRFVELGVLSLSVWCCCLEEDAGVWQENIYGKGAGLYRRTLLAMTYWDLAHPICRFG